MEYERPGTGVCSYRLYTFEVDGMENTLSTLDGCSGPDAPIPPNHAIAELKNKNYRFYCFDPYQGIFSND